MDVAQHVTDITVGAQNATNGNQIVDFLCPKVFLVDGVNILPTTINLTV